MWMQTEAMLRVANRAGGDGAAEKREAIEVEGETAIDLYTMLEPPARSLEARSSKKSARAATQAWLGLRMVSG
jgi:hypothetical protein